MKKLIVLLLLFFTIPVFGQVSFQFFPEVYGRNIEGLLNCKIINPSGRKSGSLVLTVSEKNNGTVLVLKTTAFNLNPGVNSLPVSTIRNSAIEYYNNPIAVIIQHNPNFPPGNYEYCFSFSPAGNSLPAEQCFEYELVPFAQLHLIEPYDNDSLCDKKPTLSWEPLIPTLAGTNYQVVLSEIQPGQNAVEALNYNLPIINQSYLTSPILIYPPIANPLVDGKTYAWQVTAYQDHTILNRSEIWQFIEQCNEKKPPVIPDDGYRDIADLIKGNYYIAIGTIKFAITNPYKASTFKYQIESLNNPGKKIKGLPKIKILTGKNKILIDLADTDSFTDGYSYLMTLSLPDGTVKNLRFIYRD
jgi:hypothetical protein